MSEASFSLPSFAKINWILLIGSPRADGYHDLLTIFQSINLHDDLTFAPLPGPQLSLSCNDPAIPLDETNLVLKAARMLQRLAPGAGAAIHLEKRIPAGGGLGGGSSNAAVTLMGLARLWNLQVGRESLLEMARQLGADVPFFLFGGLAKGTGIGDRIEPLSDIEFCHLLVLFPGVSVSTAEAFKSLDSLALTKGYSAINLSVSELEAGIRSLSVSSLRNDFESVVFRVEPEIAGARNMLLSKGARVALMSGSGSSVFGVFESSEAQRIARAELEEETGWRIFSCSTVSRESYGSFLAV